MSHILPSFPLVTWILKYNTFCALIITIMHAHLWVIINDKVFHIGRKWKFAHITLTEKFWIHFPRYIKITIIVFNRIWLILSCSLIFFTYTSGRFLSWMYTWISFSLIAGIYTTGGIYHYLAISLWIWVIADFSSLQSFPHYRIAPFLQVIL